MKTFATKLVVTIVTASLMGCNAGKPFSPCSKGLASNCKKDIVVFVHSTRGDFSNYVREVWSLLEALDYSGDYNTVRVIVAPAGNKCGYVSYRLPLSGDLKDSLCTRIAFGPRTRDVFENGFSVAHKMLNDKQCQFLFLFPEGTLRYLYDDTVIRAFFEDLTKHNMGYELKEYIEKDGVGQWCGVVFGN